MDMVVVLVVDYILGKMHLIYDCSQKKWQKRRKKPTTKKRKHIQVIIIIFIIVVIKHMQMNVGDVRGD